MITTQHESHTNTVQGQINSYTQTKAYQRDKAAHARSFRWNRDSKSNSNSNSNSSNTASKSPDIEMNTSMVCYTIFNVYFH